MMLNTRQNEEGMLDLLCAQRHIYSKTKRIETYRFLVTSIVPIVFIVASDKLSIDRQYYYLMIIFLMAMDGYLISRYVANKKTSAAKIQEMFDCHVFQLDWNSAMCGAQEDQENIVEESNNYKKKHTVQDLENWYRHSREDLPIEIKRLACQRKNVLWSKFLRERFDLICVVGLLCFVFIVVIVFVWLKFDIVTGVFIVLPVVRFLLEKKKENLASMELEKTIKNLIEKKIESIPDVTNGEQIATFAQFNRCVQDLIYLNRKNGTLIPDFIYRLWRSKDEAKLSTGIDYHLTEIGRRIMAAGNAQIWNLEEDSLKQLKLSKR